MTDVGCGTGVSPAAEPCGAVAKARAWIAEMASLDADVDQDGDRIELLLAMEAVKAASAAVQARVTADFVDSQMAAAQELAAAELSAVGIVPHGLRPNLVRRSVCAQVALARREAPDRGAALVNLAQALAADLPATMAALTAGATSEYRAMLVHRETACLSSNLRREADAVLADALPRMGNRQIGDRAREQALRLDPDAARRRIREAVGGRRVTLRHAPDAMAYLTALLPAGSATMCLRSLERAADSTIAGGGNRRDDTGRNVGRGALMADTFADRITQGLIAGCDELGAPTGRPESGTEPAPSAQRRVGRSDGSSDLLAHLVMTDRAMFGADDEPAQLIGYGPIPAELARRMMAADLGLKARTWIRRLFTEPGSGRLAAMDSRSRFFPDSLKEFLLARDQQCRMPYCGAPARHADHTVSHARGGPTSAANGEWTSVNCNVFKEAYGWAADPSPDGTITVNTPTGHRYRSDEPPPPRSQPWDGSPGRGAPAVDGGSTASGANAELAEWERILEQALPAAEQSEPDPSRPDPSRPGTAETGGWAPRPPGRDGPGRMRARRRRPPARSRPRPIDTAVARRRLELLSQLRQSMVNRR